MLCLEQGVDLSSLWIFGLGLSHSACDIEGALVRLIFEVKQFLEIFLTDRIRLGAKIQDDFDWFKIAILTADMQSRVFLVSALKFDASLGFKQLMQNLRVLELRS